MSFEEEQSKFYQLKQEYGYEEPFELDDVVTLKAPLYPYIDILGMTNTTMAVLNKGAVVTKITKEGSNYRIVYLKGGSTNGCAGWVLTKKVDLQQGRKMSFDL